MDLFAPSALLLLGLVLPGVRRAAVPFLGGERAIQVASLLVALGVSIGVALAYRDRDSIPTWTAADVVGWGLFSLFAGLIAAEASPAGKRFLGCCRVDSNKALSAWILSHRRPRLTAFLVITYMAVSLAAGLMSIWLLFYLVARPESLRLPGVISLRAAAEQGWPVVVENAALRVSVGLTIYATAITSGLNGSAQWVQGSRIPRIAAGWVITGLVAVAAGTGGSAIPLTWVAAGIFAGLNACNLSFSVWVLWMFLHTIGLGGA